MSISAIASGGFTLPGKPKLMIVGHTRCGKDTVADYLKKFGYRAESSSMFCARKFIYECLKGVMGYSTFEECYEDRHNHRALWHHLIRGYNWKDFSRLSREIFAENDIYVGIRSSSEFEWARIEGLFDLCVWVDASKRVEDEPEDSFDIGIECADIVIDNNGTEEELRKRLDNLSSIFQG